MNREPTPPPEVNRVAEFLTLLETGESPRPREPRQPPVPKITHLVVPPDICVRDLADALGLQIFVVIAELMMEWDVFAAPTTPLDFATVARLCAWLGVSVEPGT
jgi:hypothetical protein